MTNSRATLFTGGTGLLGTTFQRLLPEALYPLSSELDVSDGRQVASYFGAHPVQLFIHAAAFTSPPKIDQDPMRALTANIVGTANVVKACADCGARLVYISTDYVFKGDRGNYTEDDAVQPVNKYAWSKLGGECAVRMYGNSLIVRTSFGPDEFPYPKAFSDQYTSRQSVSVTAGLLLQAIESSLTGVVHIGGPRRTVLDYARSLGSTREIEALSITEVTFSVPVDTSLDTSRFDREINGAKR